MGAAAAVVASAGQRTSAQAPGALPLANLGLEHLDIVVPDRAASARFYARIFRTALHQQPIRGTLRYSVLLGDLPSDRQVGYIAIGAAAEGRSPSIGHYCVLAKVYDRAMRTRKLEFVTARASASGREDNLPRSDYSNRLTSAADEKSTTLLRLK
jgi:hypothetical protein